MAKFDKKSAGKARKQQVREQQEVRAIFSQGVSALRDFIAPSSLEFQSNYYRIGTRYARTYFVYGYPRQIYTGWMSPLVNVDEEIDISIFIYPVDTKTVLDNLRKKVGQLEAGIQVDAERGLVRDPAKQAAIRDAEELRDKLQVGEERFFRQSLYFTVYGDSMEHMDRIAHKIETILGQQLISSKPATVQQEQGMNSVVPQGLDVLKIRRNMNTGAVSTGFPFTSSDLTDDEGILYGINMHNAGLVIFNRYTLENANMVVFAKSGAGKSFTVKLEAIRSMMMGTEVIIIDPENEYQRMSDAVGGAYVRLSLNSASRINPFELPQAADRADAENALRANLVTLHGLFRLMMSGARSSEVDSGKIQLVNSGLTPEEEADLDQALIDTYANAGITNDPMTHRATPPTIKDLYETLLHMRGHGPNLAQRIRKYTTGTFAGIFSQQSNIDINNPMVVFNIRDLEDELRPVAMYIILNYIWNRTKSDKRQRMLIVDEAWQLMKYQDSASFLFSLAKRARKYHLGLTVISQDVEDFMSSKMGRAVVSNSSMQLLLKQSTSAVDVLSNTFKLTDEEKRRLASFPVGQGLLFAGSNHVHIQIVSSPTEYNLVTTNPDQVQQIERLAEIAGQGQDPEESGPPPAPSQSVPTGQPSATSPYGPAQPDPNDPNQFDMQI